MKNVTLLIISLFMCNLLNSQINVNPDTNGVPWIAGGIPELSTQILSKYDSIPKVQLTLSSKATILPYSVDNSVYSYMPQIFTQIYNSCSQAASIGYMFTYEINRLRGLGSDTNINLYHPSFTYNFLNYGTPDSGTFIHHGLEILEEFGCPDEVSIKYRVKEEGNVSQLLYSPAGTTVDSRPLGKKKPGTYEASVSVAPLNQGMYFIVLAKDDVLVCSRKILKAD